MAFSNGFVRPFSLTIVLVMISATQRNDALAPQYEFEPVAPDFLSAPTGQSCDKIDKDSLCGEQPYTLTTFPNLLQQDAAEAKSSLNGYRLLLQNNCSEHLHFFLCSVHMPMCTIVPPSEVVVVPPCRPLCLRVQSQCESILKQFGYTWPEALACGQFPEQNGHNTMCMPGSIADVEVDATTLFSTTVSFSTVDQDDFMECDEGSVFINSSGQCVLSCNSNLVTSESDKRFAELFHALLVGFTCLLAISVVIFHCCNAVHLSEAEKPVFCILICFIMISIGYIVRLIGGREIGCGPEGGLISNDLQVTGCVVVFFLLYYFGLAGHIWWFILVVTWFQEVIQKKSKKTVRRSVRKAYCFGWIVPLFPTTAIIVAKLVDSDQLMAICYVGQLNAWNMLFFVIVPLMAIAGSGTCVLFIGFIRQQEKVSTRKADAFLSKASLDNDAHYLGACVAMYLPSAFIVIGCYFYDFATKDDHFGKPAIAVYGLRVFFQFIYGILISVWLGWNSRCPAIVMEKTQGFYPSNLTKPALKIPDGFASYHGECPGSASSSGQGHLYSSVGPLSPITIQTNLTRETFSKQQYLTSRPLHSVSDSNPETFV